MDFRGAGRVQALSRLISSEKLADIACDHAYISIGALLSGGARRAVACDLNPGPLSRAARNLARFGLSERCETRLGGGFSPLRPGECDQAVIAGVGGRLAACIISEGLETARAMSRLILQPQSETPDFRRFLHGAGFKILNETALFDGGKYYNIIEAAQGAEPAYSDKEYLFGKILLDRKDPALAAHLAGRAEKMRLFPQTSAELRGKINFLEETLKWLM
ncbi:MAG: class I SAM-dependent methyltransferase [Clostridiales bacterium]|jgi:tRNA (adenine22-N1)-methyltransferase|nr:class I SAM-dependent methyltransferase [Clostridiales bacterium]